MAKQGRNFVRPIVFVVLPSGLADDYKIIIENLDDTNRSTAEELLNIPDGVLGLLIMK